MTVDTRDQIIAILPRLRRFARALCGAAEPADDLVRRSCAQWAIAARGGPARVPLDSLMFRLLHRLWIENLRPAAPGPIEAVPLRRLISVLPEAERAVLALVCIEDRSYREAAAILELSVGTVMGRLSRARRMLAEAAGAPAPTGSTTVSEDMLMAYADGVLEGEMADAVGRAVDADPALVGRFAALRRSRALVRAAFEDVLDEEPPPRLLAAVGVAAPSPPVRRRFFRLPARWKR